MEIDDPSAGLSFLFKAAVQIPLDESRIQMTSHIVHLLLSSRLNASSEMKEKAILAAPRFEAILFAQINVTEYLNVTTLKERLLQLCLPRILTLKEQKKAVSHLHDWRDTLVVHGPCEMEIEKWAKVCPRSVFELQCIGTRWLKDKEMEMYTEIVSEMMSFAKKSVPTRYGLPTATNQLVPLRKRRKVDDNKTKRNPTIVLPKLSLPSTYNAEFLQMQCRLVKENAQLRTQVENFQRLQNQTFTPSSPDL